MALRHGPDLAQICESASYQRVQVLDAEMELNLPVSEEWRQFKELARGTRQAVFELTVARRRAHYVLRHAENQAGFASASEGQNKLPTGVLNKRLISYMAGRLSSTSKKL